MGLDFLNKKSWHTGSIKNIEKVWIREQKEKDRLKKENEREKKLLEERHQQNIKEIQVKAGYIPESSLYRMDWMVQPQQKNLQQETAEEYLTGKAVDENFEASLKPVHQEAYTNEKCEDFIKLREDPLFQIRQEEEKRKQNIRNNPMQVQQIIMQYEQKKLEKKLAKKEKKKQKKEKKDKKSKKKKTSKKSKRSSSSESQSDSDGESNSNGRSRSRSEKSKDKKSSKKSKNHRKRSSSSSDSEKGSLRDDKSTASSQLSVLSAQSKASQAYYESYLQQKLGGIVTKDEHGNLITDFGRMKKMFKPNYEKRGDTRPISEEEKAEIRKQMQQNADKINQEKKDKYASDYKNEEKDNDPTKEENKHNFQRVMQNEIYNKGNQYESLEDRMGRNRHRFQRGLDKNNSNSFA